MLARRQLLGRLAIAVAVLFVLASAFNDHSTTSVDGILWWLAIAGFVVLIGAAFAVLVGFLRSRAKGRGRSRQTGQARQTRQSRGARRQRSR